MLGSVSQLDYAGSEHPVADSQNLCHLTHRLPTALDQLCCFQFERSGASFLLVGHLALLCSSRLFHLSSSIKSRQDAPQDDQFSEIKVCSIVPSSRFLLSINGM